LLTVVNLNIVLFFYNQKLRYSCTVCQKHIERSHILTVQMTAE